MLYTNRYGMYSLENNSYRILLKFIIALNNCSISFPYIYIDVTYKLVPVYFLQIIQSCIQSMSNLHII